MQKVLRSNVPSSRPELNPRPRPNLSISIAIALTIKQRCARRLKPCADPNTGDPFVHTGRIDHATSAHPTGPYSCVQVGLPFCCPFTASTTQLRAGPRSCTT